MSIFPRFINNEFAQVARLLDDMSQFQQQATRSNYNYPFGPSSFRSFQPRFDVSEGKDAYELTGELPGCTDINVEFTDASTLTIRGRSSHSREEGARPAGLAQGSQTEQAQLAPAAAAEAPATEPTATASDSETGSTYHKASVEDENAPLESAEDYVDVSEAVATPATEAPSETVQTEQSTSAQQQQEQQQPQSKYWVSERSVGEFARTFTFPARVDQDAVRASLKDGILSVVVPKAAKATRKIIVE